MGRRELKPIEPPAHLSDRSKALWHEVVPRTAASPERLAVIQVALETLDRADQAREQLDREGLTFATETTGAVHVHPLVKVERDARSSFVRVWTSIGLDYRIGMDLRG